MSRLFRKSKAAAAAPAPGGPTTELPLESMTVEEKERLLKVAVNGRLEELFSPAWSEKTQEMLKFLYMTCDDNEWFECWDEQTSLVAIRSHLDYACFPPAQGDDSLYAEVAKVVSPEAVISVCSELVAQFIENLPRFVENVRLGADLHVQVIDTLSSMPYIKKHQYACFVRDRGYLLVWADDAKKLIPYARQIEEQLVNRMWKGQTHTMDEKKGHELYTIESLDLESEVAVPNLDVERPVQLILPFMVMMAILLNFIVLMLSLRQIVYGSLYTKTWWRFAVLLYLPVQFITTGFFSLMVVVAVLNVIGPIGHMYENSRHYSCKPPIRITQDLPHITIQCPVYKEDLRDVIIPTVESLKVAISTYEKQGGTATIFVNDDGMQLISEEERRVRQAYYAQNQIGWVARPGHNHNGFVRAGKFKKASNMNFAMHISMLVEDRLEQVQRRQDDWSDDDEQAAYKQCLEDVLSDYRRESGHEAWAQGNIRIGELILLVDSDTRVPEDCFLDAASEFTHAPRVAILQHDSGVMQVSWDFWENAISYFTRCIYFSLRYATAAGDTAAFVGHNAFLRWGALQRVAHVDELDGRWKWWSESHVSEDFEMSLKLQGLGYISRYATYSDKGFKEGVSLTVYDELNRWSKYAYGCSELVFNPFKDWFKKGPFTTIFRTFLKSDLNSFSKITMIFYIGTYYAIALWPLLIVNVFATGWGLWLLTTSYRFYSLGWDVFVSVVLVFTVFGPASNAVVRARAKEGSLFPLLYDNWKWSLLLVIFLGGLSFHLSFALVAHMCSINMEWGATAKSLEHGTFATEVPKIWKQFKGMYFIIVILTAFQVGLAFAPWKWHIWGVTSNGPLVILMVFSGIMPFALNPNSYASEWTGDFKHNAQQVTDFFAAKLSALKQRIAKLSALGDRDTYQYRRV
ncbi:hypothetical protein PYCC9005_004091 [Savitreella phatthalungensis]